MSKVMVVTSGKGGVGKTTSSASLGAALAKAGQNVVIVDFDVGLRNLDLVMGAERRVVFDLVNVVQGDAKLAQALIRDKRLETLSLLPASQTRDKDALTRGGRGADHRRIAGKIRLDHLRQPGRDREGRHDGDALRRCRGGRHQPGSLLGARLRPHHRHAGLQDAQAESGERLEKHLLLTRYDPGRAARGEMLKVEDVLEILAIPLLGIVPESAEVLTASNMGSPGDPEQPGLGPGPRLCRGGPPAAGREGRDHDADRAPRLDEPDLRTEGDGMSFFDLFMRKRSAPVARERLQLLLAHERVLNGRADLVAVLQEEILAVIAKHIPIDRDKVNVKLDRGSQVSTLEIDIEMPENVSARN